MPPPRPPSRVTNLTFPVFGLSWHGTPSLPEPPGGSSGDGSCSVLAYCGGGGSAKTGVGNKIVVLVTVPSSSAAAPVVPSVGDSAAAVLGDAPAAATRQIDVDTGEQICVGVHLYRPMDGPKNEVRLLAAVGDEVRLYAIPLDPNDPRSDDGNSLLLASVVTGAGYGCNAVSYGPLGSTIVVGCENGTILLYNLVDPEPSGSSSAMAKAKFIMRSESPGHEKAVCTVTFHPRGKHAVSSAKDGTARIWNVDDGACLGVLKCSIDDPNKPQPKKPAADPAAAAPKKPIDPRFMKKPPQILVRGCAYGDLEGKIIYTVASGRRGPAYLSGWRLVPTQQQRGGGPPPGPGGGIGGPPPGAAPQPVDYREQFRIKCAPVPVSAMSLSGDASILTLGTVEGTIVLFGLEKLQPVKSFPSVHDLPVTCIAARPVPLPLPGDDDEGVSYDAISASADNRLGLLTLQRRSRRKKGKTLGTGKAGVLGGFGVGSFLLTLAILLLVALVLRDMYDLCYEEIVGFDIGKIPGCMWHEALWADPDRPGIRSVPH